MNYLGDRTGMSSPVVVLLSKEKLDFALNRDGVITILCFLYVP
jgi:hypothetical protein